MVGPPGGQLLDLIKEAKPPAFLPLLLKEEIFVDKRNLLLLEEEEEEDVEENAELEIESVRMVPLILFSEVLLELFLSLSARR